MSDRLGVLLDRIIENELVRTWKLQPREARKKGRTMKTKTKTKAARTARTARLLDWRDEVNATAKRLGAKATAAALNGKPLAKPTTKKPAAKASTKPRRMTSAEACRAWDAAGTLKAKPRPKTMAELSREWNADPARARD